MQRWIVYEAFCSEILLGPTEGYLRFRVRNEYIGSTNALHHSVSALHAFHHLPASMCNANFPTVNV